MEPGRREPMKREKKMKKKVPLLLLPLFILFVTACEPPDKVKRARERDVVETAKKATEDLSQDTEEQSQEELKKIFGEDYEEGKLKPKRLTDKELEERNLLMLARHILIAHKDARGAKPGTTRSKEEARELAEEIDKQLREEGAVFTDVAKKNSDCNSAERGGMLGKVRKGQMVSEFETEAFKLKPGEISGVVESPYGFHVIQRLKYEEVGASHILIAYKGAMRANPDVTRTKEEALKLVEDVLFKVKQEGNFHELATEYSDCPSAKNGGRLGVFSRGRMVPEFENAAFNLTMGAYSDIVETPFGYHIIWRTE